LLLIENSGIESQIVPKRQLHSRRSSPAKLDKMIEEATLDAYGDSEQLVGFLTMLEEHLEVPFRTTVLEITVTVEQIDMTDDDQIVAVCSRGNLRQSIPILSLTLPAPPPGGAEWIEAFRRWARHR
jgi:hypothetical protein